MKNQNLIYFKRMIIILGIFFLFVACKDDKKTSEEKTAVLAIKTETDSCSCETSWFPHTQTPAPEEGKGSPFDVSSTTNCIFHQWSWQKFLWLTMPQSNNNPLFLNELTQVNDALQAVTKQAGATIVLNSATDIEQAGSNGVLKANPAYGGTNQIAKDFTVYYSIHSNATMIKAAKNFKDSLATGKLSPNNLRTFPVGSLELKVSWIDVNTIKPSEQKNYFTTTAAVSTDGGKTFTKKSVALLGMHVVGVVINHPEFIWATFQHNDIAPAYDWKANQVSADDKLLFAKGSTTGLDGITWTSAGPKLPNKTFDLFHYGVPLTSGGQYMQTSQSEPMNYNNIQSINQCVASELTDVWNNYFYNGSIWLNTDGMTSQQQAQLIVNLGNGIGSAKPGSNARGSLNNANVTMETYTQSFQSDISKINNTNVVNCFTCHTGVSFDPSQPKSPLYVSHVFDAYIQSSQGKTRGEINRMKDTKHQLQFVKKTVK